jgi:serine protease Do
MPSKRLFIKKILGGTLGQKSRQFGFVRHQILVFMLVFTLGACETTGLALNEVTYNPFFTPADHIEQLIKEGKLQDADSVFDLQRNFFTPKKKNQETESPLAALFASSETDKPKNPVPEILADAITKEISPRAEEAIQNLPNSKDWPLEISEWKFVENAIDQANFVVKEFEVYTVFNEPSRRPKVFTDLRDQLSALKQTINQSKEGLFEKHSLLDGLNFFAHFPLKRGLGEFFNDKQKLWLSKVEGLNADQLATVFRDYKPWLSTDLQQRMGISHFKSTLSTKSKSTKANLRQIIAAIKATKETGLPLDKVPGLNIAFIEVTSKTLLKEGQIDFSSTVDVDLPFEVTKAGLDDALINPAAKSSDYLVVFDVALAKAKRRVIGMKKMPSKVLVGHRTDPNPQYNVVQNEVNNARLNVQQAAMGKMSADSQFCQGLGCFGKLIGQMAAVVAQSKANKKLQNTMARLNSTPMTLETPIYEKYNFDKASVKASKSMTVHYYVIDRPNNSYLKSTFDIKEEESFEVAYRIHKDDPNKYSHLSSLDKEEDVVDWEDAAVSIKLSQLVDHYLANASRSKKLPSVAVLRKEMLTDKNTALAKYEANTFDARPLNDPRFDSVVVIYTGEGSLGTGFFVKPDTVLTNWHVVEGSKFVEMKMYNGQETFGRILVSDVRLDLALIKVQSRGKPVQFYNEKKLDLGKTVEAIGHPKGLNFSITRGVISAIRKGQGFGQPKQSGRVLAPRSVGGDEVLYIQTDASINAGNSGGPLYLNDKVVGVNVMGGVKSVSEGLNFAIHYSEVFNFLRENLPGFIASRR